MTTVTYRSIMTPLDGSAFAEQALPLAIAVATRTGAALHLVQVEEVSSDTETRHADRGDDEQYPAVIAQRIAEETGIDTTAARLPGRTTELLTEYATQHAIDLVVIATHALSGWSRLWHGSITDTLIKELQLPFLTIRPGEEDGEGMLEIESLDHILIPLDGSTPAESVIDYAVALGGEGVRISLIQVIAAPLPNDPASISFALTVDQETAEAESAEAVSYLDEIAGRIASRVGRVDTAVILETRPLNAIFEYTDLNDVDLIAIATYGQGGMRRDGLGSTAKDILRHAAVPVLVFRPPEP